MKKLAGGGKFGSLVAIILFLSTMPGLEATAPWRTNTDLPGMDLTSFTIDKDVEPFVAVKQCETACQNNAQCKAFTYVKPGRQGPHGVCYLKSGVPPETSDTCCTSGILEPDTVADRCRNYALTARQQAVSNEDWGCGYSGLRWSLDDNLHYGWCLNAQQSAADHEQAERNRLLKQCLQPSTTGDLAAFSWCYDINDERGEITFRPVIRNAGQAKWQSGKSGHYKIGVGTPSGLTDFKEFDLPAFPHWSLDKDHIAILPGVTLLYFPDGTYSMENIWLLKHSEDVNTSNNQSPGLTGAYKGTQFKTHQHLMLYMCTTYKDANARRPGPIAPIWPKTGKSSPQPSDPLPPETKGSGCKTQCYEGEVPAGWKIVRSWYDGTECGPPGKEHSPPINQPFNMVTLCPAK